MKMLEYFRKMSGEAIDDLKAPFRLKMVNRTFDSLVEAAEEKRIDSEQELLDLRKRLSMSKSEAEAREIIKSIGQVKLALEAKDHLSVLIAAEKAEMNSEAPKVEK